MGSEKPNFLSQPVVKNVFMFRNGDPYYEARRIVINEKRVSNFETLLREVTGGIQAPFGAVRNIYTPRGGHKVDCMESLQGGEQYVAAGKEKFKKLDYLDIGTRKKRMMQTLPAQARPLPQNRIIVSARFLKPIKEPCTIFVVANGDVLNPAMRLLIHQRMMDQFERILEMITEKMGLRILGGVRSLYTYEGHQVADGSKLECGQLYVAVGRERFKKLPYSDLLFTRPKGTRRIRGMKAHSLPPIYRFSKQSGNSKSTGRSSDSGDRDSKASPPNHCGNSKEDLASTVREISQARLLTLRKKKSGQSITADSPDNDDREPQDDSEDTESKTSQDQRAEEKSDASDGQSASKEDSENTEEEPCSENATETDGPKDDKEQIQDTDVAKEEEEKMETDEQNDEKEEGGTDMNEQKVEEVKEVKEESKNEVNIEDQASTSSPVDDKPQDNKELKEDLTTSSEAKKEQDDDTEEDKQERAGNREESSNGHSNDADTGEARKQTENGSMPGETQSDNEKKGSGATGSSSRTSNQEEDVIKSKDEAPIESGEEEKINGEVETQVEPETKNSVSCEDATAAREQEDDAAKDNQDN
ncbi:doublecortin domain-containing protein 2 [Poecilia reticulata]|uniref:doublecortin domain-containing protein 2 n=1 Tax=Poecilia reticulata TaxID=8081 RepID=UPI0004A4A468|nr:PREDICTED: doublecortin domain-containing protein 2 [Poecilia reticulata]